jgi:hypothetical protein
MILLGVAMQFSLVLQKRKGMLAKAVLGVMALVVFGLTLADNTKKTAVDFAVVLVAVGLSFNVRWKLRWIIPGVSFALVVLLYIVPAIQIVRTQTDVRSIDRIGATLEVISDNDFDVGKISQRADRVTTGYQITFSDSYVYPLPWNTERFTMVQPIDQVARALPSRGIMGASDIATDILEATLPGSLIDKSLITTPDRISWFYGFRRYGSISRPVVGIVASSLAACGFIGVLLMPALTVGMGFVLINYFAGYMSRNVWAVYMFSAATFLPEKEVGTFISFFGRSFWFNLIFGLCLLIIKSLTRRRGSAGRAESSPKGLPSMPEQR